MHIRTAIALAIGHVTSAAWAGETPLYQPAPEWVALAPSPDPAKMPSDGSAMLILDQQHRLDDDGRWSYLDSAMRATSAEVLGQMGTISLPWHPSKGDLIVHRVQILRGGDTIDVLATGSRFAILQREQQLEQQQLTGILTATMAVEGLRVGDIVRLSFSVTQKDPALDGNVEAGMILAAEPAHIQFARARLLWPETSNVRWKTFGALPEVKEQRTGALRELTIALPLAKQPEIPNDAPARFRRPPILEASTFSDWGEVSRTAAPLYRTEGLIAPGSALAAEVSKISAAESDPRKRVAMALRLVQDEVRYLFRGMDQGNYVPQAPARTWELRYGDCKAKTVLLLAMLRDLGIEAEPVLANSQLGDWLPERLPSLSAFDHVLVRAEIGGKTLWLDGTRSGTRLQDLEDSPALGHVLPVREEDAELAAVPTRPTARPDVLADLELDQSAGISFPPPFKLSLTIRGAPADMLRLASAQAGADKMNEVVDGLVGNFINDGAVVTRTIAFDEDDGSARVEASGLANLQWSKQDDRHQVVLDKMIPTIGFEPDRSRLAWQQIPVATAYPYHQILRTRLRLPNGGSDFSLDGDQRFSENLAGLDLARESRLDGDWLVVEERMAARDAEVPAERIGPTRERLTLARTRLFRAVAPEAYPARWQEIGAAKAAKRLDPILAVYQKGIEDDPDDARPYRNRAIFLSGVYERRKAIADLNRVLELEPDVATYLWRSRLLADLGENDKALADLEAARRLDPGSDDALNQLATLHAHRGEHDLALALVDERISVGGKDKQAFMALKADILARAGRVDEALRTFDAAVVASPGNPSLLNGRCWLKGTRNVALDTALKDCTKAIELAEYPVAALDSRAMVYFRMGRLEEALADLEAAYSIDQHAPSVMFLRGVIRRRTGDATGADADIAAARMMSPRIAEDYAEYGMNP